jgi:hypothetical protein
MEVGLAVETVETTNSLIAPATVIRPILPPRDSSNQRAPSEPDVMSAGEALAVAMGNSVIAPGPASSPLSAVPPLLEPEPLPDELPLLLPEPLPEEPPLLLPELLPASAPELLPPEDEEADAASEAPASPFSPLPDEQLAEKPMTMAKPSEDRRLMREA